MIKVVQLQRKPWSFGAFSIEALFEGIRQHLPASVHSSVLVSRYPSKGIWMRIYNMLEAALCQGDVKHITGDVHYLALLLSKRKSILTIHDCYTLYIHSGLSKLFFQLFWYYLPVRRVKYVVAISEATKQEIVKFTNCNPDKIRVIPDFIADAYQPVKKTFNARKPVILHVGLAPNKNLDRLIEALEGIPSHLMVVGKLTTDHLEKLKRHHIEYSYEYNISDTAMVRKYEECDILAFASTYEGFGMPIIEANAVGRPVLTSNISSMPEVAGDGACLVDPYNVQSIRAGLLKIIEDEAYRELLVENGFKNRERFNVKDIAERYAELYYEITGNPTRMGYYVRNSRHHME